MYIKNVISQHRRDMVVYMECEHCFKGKKVLDAYDDKNYHENVIPDIPCKYCGKKSPASYKPRTPKYPEGMTV